MTQESAIEAGRRAKSTFAHLLKDVRNCTAHYTDNDKRVAGIIDELERALKDAIDQKVRKSF